MQGNHSIINPDLNDTIIKFLFLTIANRLASNCAICILVPMTLILSAIDNELGLMKPNSFPLPPLPFSFSYKALPQYKKYQNNNHMQYNT
ncbi:hypothetical protein Pint_08194 [Pistacia integerrima]|uniref:Uncharacterized protein n=1 Tax=Pistacia integerrima TaxID=434235 RepID=A0ACC0XVC3_9ROSI|nr:hypothetical protein Pint_08194 [Pistacia integerrima]